MEKFWGTKNYTGYEHDFSSLVFKTTRKSRSKKQETEVTEEVESEVESTEEVEVDSEPELVASEEKTTAEEIVDESKSE